jgi:hypothetical protein
VSSYEHSNVTDGSLAVNSNRAERDVEVGGGVAVKLTPGASVSGGGGGGGGVVSAVSVGGGVGAVNVTVPTVVAPGGGGVRFGFGLGGTRRGCVVTAGPCVLGGAATVGWVAVGAASVVTVSFGVVWPFDGTTGGFGFVTACAGPGRAGAATVVLGVVGADVEVDVDVDAETVTGAGAVARVARPSSVAVPTPLATRSTAAPVATTTAAAPRGRASRATRPLGRQ